LAPCAKDKNIYRNEISPGQKLFWRLYFGLATKKNKRAQRMQHHAPLKVGSRGRGASDKRQKVMEACLRKVRENRTSMIAQLRTLSPASFRSEIGKIINYEWSAIEHDPGISDRDTELETIIALEQAFLEDIRREGEPQLLPPLPILISVHRMNTKRNNWWTNTSLKSSDLRRNSSRVCATFPLPLFVHPKSFEWPAPLCAQTPSVVTCPSIARRSSGAPSAGQASSDSSSVLCFVRTSPAVSSLTPRCSSNERFFLRW